MNILYGLTAVAFIWAVIEIVTGPCKHKRRTFPSGGYGATKMTGIQKCWDCGAERFYKFGEPGEWFYRKYQRSGK